MTSSNQTQQVSTVDNASRSEATARNTIVEKQAWHINGLLAIVVLLALLAGGGILIGLNINPQNSGMIVIGAILLTLSVLLMSSLTVISPGQTKVLQFFGTYVGTIHQPGVQLTIPLTTKQKVSVKVNNFETNELKVNDADGNPINIAAIIVWQVTDTARCVFAVENYAEFVAVQAEAALRHIANSYPYDNGEAGEDTLRGSTEKVSQELEEEVAARISIAGLQVIEARISSLAYAPEIAQAMLQRQQAAAVIAAREKIVEGAVSMVEDAINALQARSVIELDDERKAAMVSNLLVVLCSDSQATPVVNTGTLYN